MIKVRHSSERGLSQHDWLTSRHTFSFADYQDANFMGFHSLRVINEDIVIPEKGFGKHAHNNMEIISYVISGTLAHQDSLGTGSLIKPGEIQRMSAGSGIQHSEYNQSGTESLHFLQIWIIPNKKQITPSYEQKAIPKIQNQLILVASNKPFDDAITIHQDISIYAAYLTSAHKITHSFGDTQAGWLQLVKGEIQVNGITMKAGDGAAISDEPSLQINCIETAELLLFDIKI